MANYWLLGLAAISNIVAVFLAKASQGMSRPWATFGVVVTILLTQWLIALTMQNGLNVGAAVTSVVVAVIVGSLGVGLFFGDRMTVLQLFGVLLSVGGIVMINLGTRGQTHKIQHTIAATRQTDARKFLASLS
jgi:quaternary ammonium compound-resistance protein SugE